MDDETKKNSLKKADSITSTIAYPDELLNDEILENYFKSLKVHCNNFLECYLNSYAFAVEQKLEGMKQPVDQTSWLNNMFVTENQISYSPNDNKISNFECYFTVRNSR